MPDRKPKSVSKSAMARVRSNEMGHLKSIAMRWRWPETEVVSHLVAMIADLDVESQAFVLGLPIDESRTKEIGCKTANAIAKKRTEYGTN